MATSTVWKFAEADGARDVLARLESPAKEQIGTIDDAGTVSWAPGARRPRTRQLHSLTGAGALGGAFWGMLRSVFSED